jgi:hypothetical protein
VLAAATVIAAFVSAPALAAAPSTRSAPQAGSLAFPQPAAGATPPLGLPRIQPRSGRAFVPSVGDWEGAADGFAASFELSYDPLLRRRAGIPQYGVSHVVLLRPDSCPVNPTSYAEEVIGGLTPGQIGAYGSLNLQSFGLLGTVTGAGSATVSGRYSALTCAGVLTWQMHPAQRVAVTDGLWTARFSDGESERFVVEAGGRLAVSLRLPVALARCNGLRGAVDLFIAADGTATYTGAGLVADVGFNGATAIGTLDSTGKGCAGGPVRFTASTRAN